MRPLKLLAWIVLAIAASTSAHSQTDQWRSLLGSQQLTPEIALSKVEEAKGTIVVQLDGQETCAFRHQLPKRLSDMTIQAWLLQADGTALAQSRQPTHVAWGNGGCEANPVQFWFRAGGPDPVAVVMSIDGAVVARGITARSSK